MNTKTQRPDSLVMAELADALTELGAAYEEHSSLVHEKAVAIITLRDDIQRNFNHRESLTRDIELMGRIDLVFMKVKELTSKTTRLLMEATMKGLIR